MPETLQWNVRAPMPLPRAGCAVGVRRGHVVVAGGTYWTAGAKVWCDRADEFDPVANAWTPLPAVPRLAGDAAAVVVGDRFVVLGGGGDGPGEAAVWVLADGRWERWPELPAPRRSCAAAVHAGGIFVLGGLAGAGTDFASATSTVWRAEPGGAWMACAPVPGPARFGAAVGSVGGVLLVAGGCTPEAGSVRNLDTVLAYDARADAWSTVGRLPFACRGAAPLAEAGRLVLFGGYTDQFCRDVLAVNPRTAAVSRLGELPLGLADSRFVRLGPRVLGLTGEDGIKRRFPDTLETTFPRA